MSNLPPAPTMTPEQCRAARGVLRITTTAVREAVGMGQATLVKFEAGGDVRPDVVARLRELFEARGVTFAPDGQGITWQAAS